VFSLGILSRHDALLKRTLVLSASLCAEIRSVSRTSIRFESSVAPGRIIM
jgi:hypothetical protein